MRARAFPFHVLDRKSTRLNSSHTEIYTLSLHDALPILPRGQIVGIGQFEIPDCLNVLSLLLYACACLSISRARSEEHTSELQSHRDLHSFPTRRSSDLAKRPDCWYWSV